MPAWQKAQVEEQTLVAPSRAQQKHAALYPACGWDRISDHAFVFRPFPLSPILMRWDARIVEFEWDDHFCDEQAQGPFAYWRHCHRVSDEVRDEIQGTQIVDDLVYELPLGVLSEPAHALIVRRQIKGIFRHRQQRLLELL